MRIQLPILFLRVIFERSIYTVDGKRIFIKLSYAYGMDRGCIFKNCFPGLPRLQFIYERTYAFPNIILYFIQTIYMVSEHLDEVLAILHGFIAAWIPYPLFIIIYIPLLCFRYISQRIFESIRKQSGNSKN